MNEFENLTLAGEKFLIGEWEIVPSECIVQRQLATGFKQRKLTPRAMDVLVHLARYSGQVISAEAFLDELWNGTFTTSNAVQKCIAELRHAFDDNPRNPRVLQTVPKRGYKLLVKPKPVHSPEPLSKENVRPSDGLGYGRTASEPSSVMPSATDGAFPEMGKTTQDQPEAPEPVTRGARITDPKRHAVVIAASVTTCVIAAVGLIAWTATASSARIPVFTIDGHSAAIVVADTDAPDLQEHTNRLHTQLVARLGELTAGTVTHMEVPASSVEVLSGPSLEEIGYVAELEVISSTPQLEVSLQITPAATALPFLDERLEDTNSEKLVAHIADDLTLILNQREIERMRDWGTRNVHAFQHVRLGASVRKHLTPNLLEVAQQHFEQAIKSDPHFTSAYSALGGVLNDTWLLSEDTKSREAVRSQTQALLRTARVNGIGADAILGLEQLLGRLSAASPRDNEAHWRRRLHEDPDNVEALGRYSEVLLSAGLTNTSRRYLDRAISLAPPDARPWLEMHYATLAGAQGDVRQEIELCKTNVDRFPDFTISTICLVRNLARAGDYVQAEWYLERLRQSDPQGRWSYAAELSLGAMRGDLPKGSSALRTALEDPRATNLARGNTCFMVGDIECGMRYWKQIEPGLLPLLWEFNVTQEWYWADGVIEDVRYQELLDQLGMGQRWRHYVRDRAAELASVTGIPVTSPAGNVLTADTR